MTPSSINQAIQINKTGLRNAYERPQLHEVKLAVNVLYEKILLPNNVGDLEFLLSCRFSCALPVIFSQRRQTTNHHVIKQLAFVVQTETLTVCFQTFPFSLFLEKSLSLSTILY